MSVAFCALLIRRAVKTIYPHVTAPQQYIELEFVNLCTGIAPLIGSIVTILVRLNSSALTYQQELLFRATLV